MAKLLYLYVSEFGRDHTVPPHSHPCHEIVYYKRARGKSYYEPINQVATDDIDFTHEMKKFDKQVNFSDNTFLIYPPNVLHDEATVGEADIVSIGFYPEDDYEKEVSRLSLQTIRDDALSVWKYIKILKSEFIEKEHGYKSMLDCYTRALLIHLSRQGGKKSDSSGINYIVSYLDEYYMTNVDIDTLAKKSGFSPSRFRVLFKEKTGVSPKQYILNRRMEYIKSQLVQTNYPLQQIAYQSGFKNYYQFSAFFKSQENLSPKAYRKKYSSLP